VGFIIDSAIALHDFGHGKPFLFQAVGVTVHPLPSYIKRAFGKKETSYSTLVLGRMLQWGSECVQNSVDVAQWT
jgi:hypothetical protein